MTASSPLTRLTATPSALAATLRLLALGSIGISRTRWLLGHAEPELVVESLLRGVLPEGLPDPATEVRQMHVAKWAEGLRAQDVDALVARNIAGSHLILDSGHELWPFPHDPDPPVLLFVAGDPEVLHTARRVGVVGTRRCSAVGRSVAGEIGFTLAEHGVSVVSGLALGVDGAAFRGAGASLVDPGRIGVVASGLDMVYPTRNEALWNEVVETGVMISETPMGERATRWRFPARNRLIAALSELLVVVESHERGGALITVDEAAARGVDVVAVPGSVLGASCRGTNQLLMDGVPPVRGGSDIVDMLGIAPPDQLAFDPIVTAAPSQPMPSPSVRADSDTIGAAEGIAPPDRILQALQGGPVAIDPLAVATGVEIAHLLPLLHRLKRDGIVEIDGSVVALSVPERG